MKIPAYHTLLLLLLLGSPMTIQAQLSTTNTPDPSAALDIVATDKGVLIPQVALTNTAVAAPITSPAQSLLVYNTNAVAGGIQPGYYFWKGTPGAWTPLVPATTNVLSSSGNTLTATVNGITSTAPIINSNTLLAPSGKLKSTVNGVASAEVDLNTFGKTYTALNPAVTNATVPLAFTGTQITAHSRSPLWNVNQLLGRNLATTPAPTTGNVLQYNGTAWAPAAATTAGWGLSGNDATTAQFIGTTNDTPFIIKTGTTTTEKLRVTKDGFIGIGTTTPTAPLQFGNTIGRKVVLYDTKNNNHEYYGLGIANNIFVNQVNSSSANFGWFAGKSATESTELLRLTGAGKLGIGATPSYMLDVKLNVAQGYASRMYNTEIAPEPAKIFSTYFRSNTDADALQGAWIGTQSSHGLALMTDDKPRLIITAGSNVGIGPDKDPTTQLDVQGTMRIRTLATGVAADQLVTTDTNGNLHKIAATTIGKIYTEIAGVATGTDAFVVNNTANTLQVNHATPVWNANQLRGKAISSTLPTIDGQVLTYNGSQWAPQLPADNDSFKIITGYVKVEHGTATVISIVGVGFTVTPIYNGYYQINFTTPFTATPAVTANILQDQTYVLPTRENCLIKEIKTNSAVIITGDASGTRQGRSFNFMAVLQK